MTSYVVVIPTLGRPCLQACLDALAAADGPRPRQVVLADDRRDTPDPLPVVVPDSLADRTVVVTLEGRGPAAARNAGWRAAGPTDWVAFLDDDVRVGPDWRDALAADLAGQPDRVAGVQGVIDVPLPADRAPTDWERGTAGLADARWITADLAYRRTALLAAGGFDERFPRAFREDADLALRLLDQGWELRQGARRTTHPVRPASRWASLKAQAG
ncbi:MAG TPA: glycosyltransferase, partial [Streptosporangiaceae bacterium]